MVILVIDNFGFQLTAARRRLVALQFDLGEPEAVSTHSRAKAAGNVMRIGQLFRGVSTHSRAKAAGLFLFPSCSCIQVSTHSRAKAAGWMVGLAFLAPKGFNSQPREGGWREAAAQFAAAQAVSTHSRAKAAGDGWACIFGSKGFQLTAARRRLGIGRGFFNRNKHKVSTHSRAKAAGFTAPSVLPLHSVSTHSRAKAAGSQKSAKA